MNRANKPHDSTYSSPTCCWLRYCCQHMVVVRMICSCILRVIFTYIFRVGKGPARRFLFTAYSVATQHSVKTQQSVHNFGATKVWREILFFRQRRRLTFPSKPHKEDLELLLETSQLRKQSHHHMIFCVQCFCQRGGFSFILCEQNLAPRFSVHCYCITLIWWLLKIALVLLMSLKPLP